MPPPATMRWIAPLLALLAGCSLIPGRDRGPQAPAPIRLSVTAGTRLNPDENGASLPTAVRVHQLRSAARADGVELPTLLRDPKAVLGDDLLAVEEVFLEPGGSATRTVAREKDAQAVLVVAVFRRPAGSSWRDVVQLPPPRKRTELVYALEEYHLSRAR